MEDARFRIKQVDFWKEKYGPELLVDISRIEATPNFISEPVPHRLSFYDIAFITRGEGTFYLDFQTCPVAPGHVFFTSPGQIRRWHVAPGLTGYVLFFTAEFVNTFFNDALFLHELHFFHVAQTPLYLSMSPDELGDLETTLLNAEAELQSLQPDSEHMLRALLYQMLIKLNRLYSTVYGVGSDSETSKLMYRFRRVLEQHFREKHQVQDYANLLGVTSDHLNEYTKHYTGATAGTFIRDRILLEAKRLLHYTGETVAEVAYSLRFKDPSYFARFFKRYVGVSPTRFRQKKSEKYQHFPEM